MEVQFRLPPDGKVLPHPCIVLSNEEINEYESGFVAVMLTSEIRYKGDEYSFEILDDMLTKPHKKKFCAARMHLIGNFIYRDVIINSQSGAEMRTDAFRRLVTSINKVTFKLNMELVVKKE